MPDTDDKDIKLDAPTSSTTTPDKDATLKAKNDAPTATSNATPDPKVIAAEAPKPAPKDDDEDKKKKQPDEEPRLEKEKKKTTDAPAEEKKDPYLQLVEDMKKMVGEINQLETDLIKKGFAESKEALGKTKVGQALGRLTDAVSDKISEKKNQALNAIDDKVNAATDAIAESKVVKGVRAGLASISEGLAGGINKAADKVSGLTPEKDKELADQVDSLTTDVTDVELDLGGENANKPVTFDGELIDGLEDEGVDMDDDEIVEPPLVDSNSGLDITARVKQEGVDVLSPTHEDETPEVGTELVEENTENAFK